MEPMCSRPGALGLTQQRRIVSLFPAVRTYTLHLCRFPGLRNLSHAHALIQQNGWLSSSLIIRGNPSPSGDDDGEFPSLLPVSCLLMIFIGQAGSPSLDGTFASLKSADVSHSV